MLFIGKQITTPNDPLQPAPVEKVFRAIQNPNGEVAALLNRLQQIRAIDPNKYRKLKIGLPYMVCADFRPRIRKKENFLSTQRFILDIDDLTAHDIDQERLRGKLKKDPKVEMFLSSPSGDGIKVLFRLQDRIADSGYYSQFYKAFCIAWARAHQLEAALDLKTHDVSRCCFVSYDPNAHYNDNVEPIIAEDYLSEVSFADFDGLNKEIESLQKQQKETQIEKGIPAAALSNELPDDVLRQIKERVGRRVRSSPPKEYIQPEELQSIVRELEVLVGEVGAKIEKTEPISYGRRIRISAGQHWAELNVFYGKKGATVVKTTKTGSNAKLAETIFVLIKDYFNQV